MQLLRITVKPKPDGSIQIRLQGRDDAGNLIDRWMVARDRASAAGVIESGYRALITHAAEVSEEEGSPAKAPK